MIKRSQNYLIKQLMMNKQWKKRFLMITLLIIKKRLLTLRIDRTGIKNKKWKKRKKRKRIWPSRQILTLITKVKEIYLQLKDDGNEYKEINRIKYKIYYNNVKFKQNKKNYKKLKKGKENIKIYKKWTKEI